MTTYTVLEWSVTDMCGVQVHPVAWGFRTQASAQAWVDAQLRTHPDRMLEAMERTEALRLRRRCEEA
jgi:hypothetical protein